MNLWPKVGQMLHIPGEWPAVDQETHHTSHSIPVLCWG